MRLRVMVVAIMCVIYLKLNCHTFSICIFHLLTLYCIYDHFHEIGRYLLMIKGMFSKPENMKMYWKEFMHQCSEIG